MIFLNKKTGQKVDIGDIIEIDLKSKYDVTTRPYSVVITESNIKSLIQDGFIEVSYNDEIEDILNTELSDVSKLTLKVNESIRKAALYFNTKFIKKNPDLHIIPFVWIFSSEGEIYRIYNSMKCTVGSKAEMANRELAFYDFKDAEQASKILKPMIEELAKLEESIY